MINYMDHHQSPMYFLEQTPVMSLTKKCSIFGDMSNFWDKPHATEQNNIAQQLDFNQMQPKQKSFEELPYDNQVEYNDFSLEKNQEIVYEQNSYTPKVHQELPY